MQSSGQPRDARLLVRRIGPSDPDHYGALHLALGIERDCEGGSRYIDDLLTCAERQGFPIELLFAAYAGQSMVYAAALLESPGSTALLSVPAFASSAVSVDAATGVLAQACRDARNRSIGLLQVLLDPLNREMAPLLAREGFRHLTQLLYLTRRAGAATPRFRRVGDLSWFGYRADLTELFCRALEATYTQSLDCPELTGLRRTPDVLAGHKASGVFDPSSWWVVTRGDVPAGILLLNRIRGREGLELVYMGVAAEMRRQGIANALLERAVTTLRALGANYVSLAVDCRNIPARRLYERWGFEQFASRDAWIATLLPTGA